MKKKLHWDSKKDIWAEYVEIAGVENSMAMQLSQRQREILYYVEHLCCVSFDNEVVLDLGSPLKATAKRMSKELWVDDHQDRCPEVEGPLYSLPVDTIPPPAAGSLMWLREQGRPMHLTEILFCKGVPSAGYHDAFLSNEADVNVVPAVMDNFVTVGMILGALALVEKYNVVAAD